MKPVLTEHEKDYVRRAAWQRDFYRGKASGLSNEALAEKLNVSVGTIKRVLSGRR